jgi:hypothetical protein
LTPCFTHLPTYSTASCASVGPRSTAQTLTDRKGRARSLGSALPSPSVPARSVAVTSICRPLPRTAKARERCPRGVSRLVWSCQGTAASSCARQIPLHPPPSDRDAFVACAVIPRRREPRAAPTRRDPPRLGKPKTVRIMRDCDRMIIRATTWRHPAAIRLSIYFTPRSFFERKKNYLSRLVVNKLVDNNYFIHI